MVRFGVGLFTGERFPGDPRSFRDVYRDLVEEARTAEAVGLDSFWISEHHFDDDGYMPAPFAIAGAMVEATSRLRIGIGIPSALHHPLRLAENFATLDSLSGGRVLALIGGGTRRFEHEVFGLDREKAVQHRNETIEIMRKAFSGEVFSHSGPKFQIPAIRVRPETFTPGGPPIYLSASADSLAQQPGSAAGYVLDSSLDSNEAVSLSKAARESNRQAEIILQNYGYVVASGDAWEVIKPGFLYLRSKYNGWTDRREPVDQSREAYRLLLGSPAELAATLAQYVSAIGPPIEFLLRLSYPGVSHESVTDALHLYADVAKRVRENVSAVSAG